MCDPLGKIFFFFMAHWGTCVDSTNEGVSSNPWGLSSSQLMRGLPLHLGPMGESFHDIVYYWGFFWKFELTGVLLVTHGLLRDALDAINLLWLLVWSSCLLPN